MMPQISRPLDAVPLSSEAWGSRQASLKALGLVVLVVASPPRRRRRRYRPCPGRRAEHFAGAERLVVDLLLVLGGSCLAVGLVLGARRGSRHVERHGVGRCACGRVAAARKLLVVEGVVVLAVVLV